MRYRACPICGSKDVEILCNLKFKLLEAVDLPDNYDLVICNECEFVYADSSATQEQYDVFYRDHSVYENGASVSDKAKYKAIFEGLIKLDKRDCLLEAFVANGVKMRKKLNKTDRILEIGFANGELLIMLKNEGYNVYGLDPSKFCVDELNARGITAFQGSIGNHSVTEKFDFIILSHVMEHILDVDSAMKSIRHLLADGGSVYIETPDMEQYNENNVTPFKYIDIEHINHFGTYSLVNLVESYGFKVMDCGSNKWPIGDNSFYPACWILAFLTKAIGSDKCRESIKSYVKHYINKTYHEIEELIRTQEEIIVWGTGSFTQRLYMQTHLDRCNIRIFVDNNKNKWGNDFAGKKIIDPSDIITQHKILIASIYGTKDIQQQIISMGLNNETIVLSEDV
jgi:SAM-dependent methyltransferase